MIENPCERPGCPREAKAVAHYLDGYANKGRGAWTSARVCDFHARPEAIPAPDRISALPEDETAHRRAVRKRNRDVKKALDGAAFPGSEEWAR